MGEERNLPPAVDERMEKSQDAVVHDKPAHDEEVTTDKEAQAGVQGIEAITIVWSKTSLIVAYVMIWFVSFIMLTKQVAEGSLNPYVTSAFRKHSLTPTVGILSSIFGGVCNLTVAKILDVFGRPHGYALSLVVVTLGTAMMAASNSVEMYAAAQVFWTVGTYALLYTVHIFVADTTALRNRGLMNAITSSGNIITMWLGGPISEAFLKGPGWRWCFGTFSILVPVFCLPLLGLLLMNHAKAKKQGIIVAKEKTRTPLQSILYYCRQFDAIGLLLVTAGLAMFLLPFNINRLQAQGWASPLIICLLVFGVALMVVFAIWERFFAPVTFLPYSLLTDRNMVGACILGFILFLSHSCWYSLFGSYLQVVHTLSVSQASYVMNAYSLGSSLFAIAAGFAIRYTGRFKAMTLYIGIPIYTLFMGLLIYFRDGTKNIGFIIMCQIFLSLASGILIITPQIAAMAATDHQHIAVVAAVISMLSSIGAAVGLTIGGAVWQSVFPAKLAEYLPRESQKNLLNIYGSLPVQLSYPVGSPTRIAIQHAYADGQYWMLAVGTIVWIIGFAAVALWKNLDVKNMKQVRGQVI